MNGLGVSSSARQPSHDFRHMFAFTIRCGLAGIKRFSDDRRPRRQLGEPGGLEEAVERALEDFVRRIKRRVKWGSQPSAVSALGFARWAVDRGPTTVASLVRGRFSGTLETRAS
jgi:hypothetical protein